MKCNLENREDLISKYLMNELSDEESLNFEEHYFTCKDCFEELKTAEQSLNLIAKEGINAFKEKEQKLKNKTFSFLPAFSTPAKIGFAFASLILLFVLYSVLNNKSEKVNNENKIISQDKKEIEQKTDSIKTELEKPVKQKDNLIAQLEGPAFETNPYYEEWIAENVRSGKNVIEKVISPENNSRFYDNVVFKWRMKEKSSLLLSILQNSEKRIFSTEIGANEFPEVVKTVTSNNFIKSGLYYWRIENEKEVLYIGKFFFLKRQ